MQKNAYNNRKNSERWPGKAYWAILITTVILLIAMTASFFVVLAVGIGGQPDNSGGDIGGAAKPSGGGKKPLSATVPTRSDYVSTKGANVAYVTDEIESNNTILVELGNYTSKAEKGADTKIYPASMTKVMSLLVACENLTSLKKMLKVSEEVATYSEKVGGSGVGLKVGEELSVEALLYLASYMSDTIAILTLAEYIAGSEQAFVAMMNNKARELGLTNTKFANCTGIHDTNNYTTCREMAAIMAYSLDNSLCKKLLTSYEGYPISTNIHESLVIYSGWYSQRFSDNPRLKTVTVTGGKTGYTDESGMCLVSYAVSRSTGKEYINVIVGKPKGNGLTAAKSTTDVKTIYNTYAE